VAELGQIDEQRSGDPGTDPRRGLQQLVQPGALRVIEQRGIDLGVELREVVFERSTPMPSPKLKTRRGLTTTTGRPAAASRATRGRS
jgi:hypothetical protein